MPIALKIRHLKSGEEGTLEFPDEAACKTWLAARPPMVDVLGSVWPIPHETQTALRAAMRPLDADEQLADRERANAAEKAMIEREKEERARELDAAKRHAEAMKVADPERIMEVHWTYDGGMQLTDKADPRAIPDAAKEAILAWIRERDEWVKGRGQIVGEATVKVYPGKLPAGETDRVAEGRFFPVTAPGNN